MSRGFKASLLVIIFTLLVLFFHPFFPGWNCTRDEINIRTGQGRRSRYIAFIRTSEEIYDTALSKVLAEPVEEDDIKAWHPVNTFCPPSKGHSPHHFFHGALHQAREADLLFEEINMPTERRTEIATEVLKAWQKTGRDDGAREVLSRLWEEREPSSNKSMQAKPNGPPDG